MYEVERKAFLEKEKEIKHKRMEEYAEVKIARMTPKEYSFYETIYLLDSCNRDSKREGDYSNELLKSINYDTGSDIEKAIKTMEYLRYIDTVFTYNKAFVWHVFEKEE
jgi:DNA-binding MarR family transcriptional regulator